MVSYMQASSLAWSQRKLAMALPSLLGKSPTDVEQMGRDGDSIYFSVVINIGSRGGLNFTIVLAIVVDCWGILNVFFGM